MAFVIAVAACSAVAAIAAESTVDAASAYKLRIANPGAFRFSASEPYVPVHEPKREPPVPARLGDKPYTQLIQNAARDAALDPALVHALIYVESRYNPAARSPKGAVGLMQVLPETAARYGVADPARSLEANLRAGTRYLSDLLQIFDSRLDLALAAYNAGEKAVQRHGQRIPPYAETQAYVPAVLAKYREWQEPVRPAPAPAPGRVRIQYLPGTLFDPDYMGNTKQILRLELAPSVAERASE
jgi:soluble lytic murein transglycosylase-like protein